MYKEEISFLVLVVCSKAFKRLISLFKCLACVSVSLPFISEINLRIWLEAKEMISGLVLVIGNERFQEDFLRVSEWILKT